MAAARQFAELFGMSLRMYRQTTWFLSLVNLAFAVGLVLGFGYIIPDVTERTALFLVTGTATQMVVTVGLVGLPQYLGLARMEGRLDFFMTLPISREAYLLSQIAFSFMLAFPAMVFALALGAWHYGFTLDIHPAVILVVPLAVFSLAGFGAAMALVSPHVQLTNALSQLIIFYVVFFAPVMIPREQLPSWLAGASWALPPSYVADGLRATLTDLPGTNLWRSVAVMAAFSAGSLALASAAVRRRG
jgi:ABC-2 type transport system permease protein